MRPKNKCVEKKRPKKRRTKRNQGWDYCNGVSLTELEYINEILHANKSHFAQGKGSWKVMPKDSCEIYRYRRQKLENQNKKYSERNNSESDFEQDDNTPNSKKKDKSARKNQRQRHKHRCEDSDSTPCSCLSENDSISYCSNVSEMDYE